MKSVVTHPSPAASVVVAGHICLDIIPAMNTPLSQSGRLVAAGKLSHIGPATISTGGAVANTGLALHRLGIQTRLVGKIGNDLFGRAILDILAERDPALAASMIKDASSPSSYTLVLSAPGYDRSFLHCAGANDTLCAADILTDQFAEATLLHFGYPPILRRFCSDEGVELSTLFTRVKACRVATSLDMAHVDVDSHAGLIDWRKFLVRALPTVDFFMPSYDEIFFMLDRETYQKMNGEAGKQPLVALGGIAQLRDFAATLLEMGVAVVVIKLGEDGIYLRTTDDVARLRNLGRLSLSPEWRDREMLAPAFQVDVVGTTGAGDCAVAGFLAALLRGLSPEDALLAAVAAGACNVEVADAISGIPTWDALQERIQNKWPRRQPQVDLQGWHSDAATGHWFANKTTQQDYIVGKGLRSL